MWWNLTSKCLFLFSSDLKSNFEGKLDSNRFKFRQILVQLLSTTILESRRLCQNSTSVSIILSEIKEAFKENFLRILCVVDDYACRRSFSALSEDAFGALASLHSQSFLYTLWFNFCSQIIVIKHDFNSMLHKIVSAKEIS